MKQYNNLEAISLFDLDSYTIKKNTLRTCPFCLASDYTYNASDGAYTCHACDKQFTGQEGGL